MSRLHRPAAWFIVGLNIGLLSWVALGHGGPTQELVTLRLVPFEEFGWAVSCIANRCRNLWPAFHFMTINGLGNIVVFVPLGASIFLVAQPCCRRLTDPFWIATLAGVILSIIYEIVQMWIPGRVTATDDILLNGLGSALGAGLVWWLMHRAHPVHVTSEGV